MNLTEKEIQDLKDSESVEGWNKVLDKIKATRQGQYPPDWWPVVMASGVAADTAAKWGGSNE